MMADWWSSPLTRCTASPAIRVTSSDPQGVRSQTTTEIQVVAGVAAVNRKHGEAASDLAGAAQPSGRHVHAGRFSPIAEAEDDCSLATLRHDPTTGKATQACASPIPRSRCVFCEPPGRWPPPAPTVPARKAHKRCRKPRTRWEMRWICIWTGERLRDMYRPRWLQPTRTSATASRFFGRE